MARTRVPQRQIGITQDGLVFSKVTGDTGAERFLLRAGHVNVPKGETFNHETSMRLLREAGLVAVDPDVEIPLLNRDYTLLLSLTEGGIAAVGFHTASKGPLNLPESQHLEDGKLVSGRAIGEDYGYWNTVRNFDGPHPVSLFVGNEFSASATGGRYERDARSETAFPVIYGRPSSPPPQASRVAEEQSELAGLLRVGDDQKVVFTYPNGATTETKVPAGTTVHLE